MLAFDRARDVGADGIELDVRFDGDLNVVVFHDSPLDRLTGRSGTMEQTSAADRAQLRVGGEPVPTLAEVLDAFDLEFDVEIKANKVGRAGELVAATAKVIADSKRAEQIMISSFDPVSLLQFHRHLPDVALAYVFSEQQMLAVRKGWVGNWFGASLAHPEHTLCTEVSVKRWHTAGMPVNVWTVDDPAELTRLAQLGVDGVFSNDPAHALAVLSAISGS